MSRSPGLLAAFFIFGGVMHFVRPRAYEAIMPPSLPRHREVVVVSGVAEIVGGGGAPSRPPAGSPVAGWSRCWSRSSPPTSTWLCIPTRSLSAASPPTASGRLLWARLLVQPLLVWWTWRAT